MLLISPNVGADKGGKSPKSESYQLGVEIILALDERYTHRSLNMGIDPYPKISLVEIGYEP